MHCGRCFIHNGHICVVKVYSSVPSPALALVNFALELRENDRSDKNREWIRDNWDQRAEMTRICERVTTTYFMYVSMFQLARPLEANTLKSCERPGLEDTSRGQRHALMGMGLLRGRGESPMVRTARARVEVQCAVQSGVATMWIDDYHRHQYATPPEGSRDCSFTSTAVALLPATLGHIAGTGWPLRTWFLKPPRLVPIFCLLGSDFATQPNH